MPPAWGQCQCHQSVTKTLSNPNCSDTSLSPDVIAPRASPTPPAFLSRGHYQPEGSPMCPQGIHKCPQRAPKCPRLSPSDPKVLQGVPNCPQSIPRVFQKCPQVTPDCPQVPPKCPKGSQSVPEAAAKRLQSIPKVSPDCPQYPQLTRPQPLPGAAAAAPQSWGDTRRGQGTLGGSQWAGGGEKGLTWAPEGPRAPGQRGRPRGEGTPCGGGPRGSVGTLGP